MWHKPFVGDVISHLPGTIVKVEAQQGQEVEAGQLLFDPPGDEDVQPGVVAPVAGPFVRAGCNGRRSRSPKDLLMVKIQPNEVKLSC